MYLVSNSSADAKAACVIVSRTVKFNLLVCWHVAHRLRIESSTVDDIYDVVVGQTNFAGLASG